MSWKVNMSGGYNPNRGYSGLSLNWPSSVYTAKLVKVNDIGGEPERCPWVSHTPTRPTLDQQCTHDKGHSGPHRYEERKVSTVEICDRCGAIGKDEVMSSLDLTTPGERTLEYGICSICRVDFDSWMALAVNSRAGTSVTTKYVNEPKISEETRMLARVVAEEFARARDNAQKQIDQ